MSNFGRVSVRALGICWSYGWTFGPTFVFWCGQESDSAAGPDLLVYFWATQSSHWARKLCQDLYQFITSQGMKLSSFLARKSELIIPHATQPYLCLPKKKQPMLWKPPKCWSFLHILEVYRRRPFRIVKEAWQSGVNNESTFVFFLQDLTVTYIYIHKYTYFPREFGQVRKRSLCFSSHLLSRKWIYASL